MKKAASLILAFLLSVCLLCGCQTTAEYTRDGLTVTLPSHYRDLTYGAPEDLSFLYAYGDIALSGVKETKEGLDAYMDTVNIENYGKLMISMNGFTDTLTVTEGIHTFVYDADVDGTRYTYLSAIYETDECFWTVQVYCPTENYEKNYDTMWGFLKSVTAE